MGCQGTRGPVLIQSLGSGAGICSHRQEGEGGRPTAWGYHGVLITSSCSAVCCSDIWGPRRPLGSVPPRASRLLQAGRSFPGRANQSRALTPAPFPSSSSHTLGYYRLPPSPQDQASDGWDRPYAPEPADVTHTSSRRPVHPASSTLSWGTAIKTLVHVTAPPPAIPSASRPALVLPHVIPRGLRASCF